MAGFTAALIAAGVALSAAGTVTSIVGQSKSTDAARKAESLRKRQMELEAKRQRREVVRQGLVTRSRALLAASAQGGQFGSGLPGGYGSISGQTTGKTVAINQNESIGGGIFDANMAGYRASQVTNFGAGLSSLGGALISNAGTINKIGTLAFGKGANVGDPMVLSGAVQ